mmetsp:Transcript_8307/g.23824  ORF Transcript_8307/g.23824 Transcript_8307/m.23824 type:complete len:108 (-) Transcript_8307:255-578(-)
MRAHVLRPTTPHGAALLASSRNPLLGLCSGRAHPILRDAAAAEEGACGRGQGWCNENATRQSYRENFLGSCGSLCRDGYTMSLPEEALEGGTEGGWWQGACEAAIER